MYFYTGGYGENSLKLYKLEHSEVSLIEEYGARNASYLIVSKDKNFLFCCNEEENGYITSYKILPGYRLEKIDTLITGAAMPCHLSLNFDDSVLFVANYMEGTIDIIQVLEGHLKLINTIHHEGFGPNLDRQEKAHVHFVLEVPNTKIISVCDLGIDKVIFYEFDDTYHHVVRKSELSITLGSGPRHLAFNKNKNIFYLLYELTNTCMVFEWEEENLVFNMIQIFVLSENSGDISSAIKVSEDNNYLFVATRGCDEITVFHIELNGELRKVNTFKSDGKWVRDFNINQEYLICANQNSNQLTVFKLDEIPLKKVADIKSDNPTCICFL
jgi:6-phosphogluconolactonase